jgi:hypothetical protein
MSGHSLPELLGRKHQNHASRCSAAPQCRTQG